MIAHEVFLADEDHDLVGEGGKPGVGEWRRDDARLALAETAEDLGLGRDRWPREFLDLDVAEGDLRLAVPVDLQGDDAGSVDGRIGFEPQGRPLAVEGDRDLIADSGDLVMVPVAGLFESGDEVRIRHGEHAVAPRLIVEATGVARADVGLEAGHFIGRIRDAAAAELDATVDESLGADQAIVELQVEVGVAARGGEEFVPRVAGQPAKDLPSKRETGAPVRDAVPASAARRQAVTGARFMEVPRSCQLLGEFEV